MKIQNRFGQEFEIGPKADLRGADLQEVNLCEADLRGAILYGADLRNANLERADLYRVDLERADLRGANFYGADLAKANLEGAHFSGAILTKTNLSFANLRDTKFYEANLQQANFYAAHIHNTNFRRADLEDAILRPITLYSSILDDADLQGADLPDFQLCPQEGSFVGYKKLCFGIVCELEILGPRTSSLVGRKCRAQSARVLRFLNSNKTEGRSVHDPKFIYKIGEIVSVPDYNDDIRIECAPGIHFFMTKEEAEKFRYA